MVKNVLKFVLYMYCNKYILCDKNVCEKEERNWRTLSCDAAENKALAALNYAIDKIRTVRVKADLR